MSELRVPVVTSPSTEIMNLSIPAMLQALRGYPAPALLALAVQVIAALFFLGDAAEELRMNPLDFHAMTEAPVAIALCLGIVLAKREFLRSRRAVAAQATALQRVTGAFRAAVEAYFDQWGLTAAERDVALLTLKGLEVPEIAAARATAQGTVRAQLAHIYAKGGVTSRTQLAAVFLSLLMTDETPADALKSAPERA